MATLTDKTKLYALYNGSREEIGAVDSIGDIGFGEADEIEVTPLNTPDGYKQYIQGLKDSGTLTIGGFKVPSDSGQQALRALFADGTVTTFTVEFSDGSIATFSAFVKKFNFTEISVSSALKWSVDLRVSGGVTFVDSAATLGSITVSMVAAGAGKGTLALGGDTSGGTLVYEVGASLTKPAYLDDIGDWNGLPYNKTVEATSGQKIIVAVMSAKGKALSASDATTVVVGS